MATQLKNFFLTKINFEIRCCLLYRSLGEKVVSKLMTIKLKTIIKASWITVKRFGWLPVVVLLAHEISAHVIDGYARWPEIDIPLHFFGGFAIAYFVAGGIKVFAEYQVIHKPDLIILTAVVLGLTATVAVLWEFAEWVADRILNTTCQIGLDDTMLDLLMGLLGGALFILIMLIKTKGSRK